MALDKDGNHVNWITTTVCNGLTQFLETVVEKPGEYRFDQHPIPPIKVLRPGSDLRTSIAPELLVDIVYRELKTIVRAHADSLPPKFKKQVEDDLLAKLDEQHRENRKLIQTSRRDVHNGKETEWAKWFTDYPGAHK